MIAHRLPKVEVHHRNGADSHALAPPNDRAMLVYYPDEEERRCWPLCQDRPLTVGRAAGCDVVLDLRRMSRRHARIVWLEQNFLLEELGSANGTFLNGARCQEPKVLHNGDEIQLALCVKLYFLDEEGTEPLVPTHFMPGITLDREGCTLAINGRTLPDVLSPPQFRLLEFLFQAEGKLVTRNEIVDVIWPDESHEGISEQAIDALVRRLRCRITDLDPDHEYIQTVRGFGFRLVRMPG